MLQDRLLNTYAVAERSLQMANELRSLYVQVAGKGSSALGTTLETVKAPFRLVRDLWRGDFVDSAKLQVKERELLRRYERLCRDLEACTPAGHRSAEQTEETNPEEETDPGVSIPEAAGG